MKHIFKKMSVLSQCCLALLCMLLVSCSADEDYDSSFNGIPTLANGTIDDFEHRDNNVVTIVFPSASDLTNSSEVQTKMTAAWNMMINSASDSCRQEFGFYIYYSFDNHTIYCGEIIPGSVTSNGEETGGSTDMGKENSRELCGSYHCHTTMQYMSSKLERQTGASEDDEDFATTKGIPCLVDDYTLNPLPGGTPSTASHHISYCGPNRKKSITINRNSL